MKTTFNKLMAWALTLAMLMSFMPGILVSAAEVPAFSGGTGTEEDPFLIADVEDLLTFNETCAQIGDFDDCGGVYDGTSGILGWGGYHGAYFKLTADIDCSSIDKWVPCTFAGHFDGDGHTISNLTIGYTSQEEGEYIYSGFFEVLYEGSISNIVFDNIDITLSSDAEITVNSSVYAGVVAGEIYYAEVDSVTVINSKVLKESTNGYWSLVNVGGIAGSVDGAYIDNCEVINTDIDSNKGYVGGIAGYIGCLYYDVESFKDAGIIFRFGGDAGKFGVENSMIDDESSVSVSGNYGVVGGMIGWVCARKYDKVGTCPGFVMKNCYSNASVTIEQVASKSVGGVIGEISYTENPVTIENCYFAGSITDNLTDRTGNGSVIGLTTRNDSESITFNNCYGLNLKTLGVDELYNGSYGGDSFKTPTGCAIFDSEGILTAETDGEVLAEDNLLDALNAWVDEQDGAVYNIWKQEDGDNYPVFGIPSYTITFDANGGSGTMADQTIDVDVETALSENAFNREGYNFDGWSTEEGGSVQYADKESVNNIAAVGESITLYAVWSKIPAIAPGVIPSQGLNLVYGEITSDDKISVTATAADDTDYDLAYQWYKGEDEISEATSASYIIPADTTVGLYSYYCEVTATRRDNGDAASVNSESISVNVAKASVSIPTVSPKVYTGETLTADITETDYYRVTTNEGGTDVGEYDVVLTLKDSVNYKWTDSDDETKTIKFEIVKSGTSFATKKLLKGDEETTEFIYGDTITVKVKPQATGEAATVTPMSLTPPTENQMALYLDDTQITDAASADSEGCYTMTIDTTTAGLVCGEITLTAKYVGSSNMADYEENITLTLAKADSSLETAPAAITSLVYNKEEQVLVNEGSGVVGGTLKYKLNNGEYSEELPKAKNAGDYTVYYKIFGDANHNDTEEQSFEVSIAEKTINPVIVLDEPVANRTPVTSIDTEEYTADVVWSPSVDNKFEYNTEYTAVITILPKANYTLTGIADDEYTIEGAGVTNEADSDTVTAVFEKTGKKPVTTSGGGFFGGGVAAGAKKTTLKEVEWANPFTDVDEDDWFYGDVRFVSENKLMNGTANSLFAPDEFITRAMLVTILYRAEDEPEVAAETSFEDVQAGAYYEDAVVWAQTNGIVKGYSDTEFAPGDNVTREQIAAIMYRYADYKGITPSGSWAISLDYADVEEIAEYAVEPVMYCTMKEIMTGKDENMFAPQDFATRAEIAAIFHRLMK